MAQSILPRLGDPLGPVHDEGAAQQDGGLADAVVLVAEGADAARLHQERRAFLQRLADPAHGEGAEDVPVADDEDVAAASSLMGGVRGGVRGGRRYVGDLVLGANLGDEPVQAVGDVFWGSR